MTLIQQPDALSFSLTMKPLIISATSQVTVELLRGDATVVTQSYTPATDGSIEIDLRDLVHGMLSASLPLAGEVTEQTTAIDTFTARLTDGTESRDIAFTALAGGVEGMEQGAAVWCASNFLTWQPSTKGVTYHTPEWLAYCTRGGVSVCLHAAMADGTGQDLTLATLPATDHYTVYSLPVGYSYVCGRLAGDTLPRYYDVWVAAPDGTRLTYIQRYHADGLRGAEEDWVLFANSLGGIDTFRAYGRLQLAAEHTHHIAEVAEQGVEYRVDTQRQWSKHTGRLTGREARWLLDFFPARSKWLYADAAIRPIVVTESSAEGEVRHQPVGYSFKFRFASSLPLLCLPRTDEPQEVLTISLPDVASFTVPPRLCEFPQQVLTEGVLFPVQEPHSEGWGVTTVSALAAVISQLLSAGAGTGGGVGHSHANIDVLRRLGMLGEYLTVNGEKLLAGRADEAHDITPDSPLYDRFLRKDRPDHTAFLQRFLGGLEVGEAIDSLTAGKGTLIDANGRIQTDRLEVRGSMTVTELILNRLAAMEQDYSFSESGTIEAVELMPDGTYTLTLRRRWEGDFTALQAHDIIYGMVNDLAAGGTDYYTSWLRVLSVDTAANTVSAVLYPDSEVPGGKNYPPTELMVVTRRGNPVDEERQGYWYISGREKCICMLDGVTKPILEESNYSIIIGRLKHLSLFDNLPINYLHTYAYCRGIAVQDILRIDWQGNPVRQENQRGLWSAEVAASDHPYRSEQEQYDSAYHCGCKWMCLLTGTLQEPRYAATDWAMTEGNPDFTIDLHSSEGWYFDAADFATTLTLTGELYHQDVTAHILDADIQWTRDTGNVTEDNAWATAHADVGKRLALTAADLGPKRLQMTGCKFIARALLRDGSTDGEAYAAEAVVSI